MLTRGVPSPHPTASPRLSTKSALTGTRAPGGPVVTSKGLFTYAAKTVTRHERSSGDVAYTRSRPSGIQPFRFVQDSLLVGEAGRRIVGLTADTGERAWIHDTGHGRLYSFPTGDSVGFVAWPTEGSTSAIGFIDPGSGEERWTHTTRKTYWNRWSILRATQSTTPAQQKHGS